MDEKVLFFKGMLKMRYLLLLFIVIPALEVMVLIWSGQTIGAFNTFALIVFTGIVGAALAKREGSQVLQLAQIQMRRGEIPSGSILDGIAILIGGVLLLTPGFLTDTTGFLLLIPITRAIFKQWIGLWLKKQITKGNGTFIYWKK
jgi:UPF0716 protein FxsA